MEKTVKVIIPQKVRNQIQYLCSRIYEVEWSGILLYNTTGEIGEDLEVTLEHIYLMNKGTATYTEFESDGSIVSFLMKNPEYFDCKKALMHSHNSMSVFFSGTDLDELYSNVEYHNYYLSVIVNNKGEVCAKIAQKGKAVDTINRVISFDTLAGTQTKNLTEVKEKEVIFVYPCEIVSEYRFTDEEFIKRTDEIIKIADEKAKVTKSTLNLPQNLARQNEFDKWWLDETPKTLFNEPIDEFVMPDDTRNEEEFTSKWIMKDMDYKGTLEQALKELSSKFKGARKAERIDDYMEDLEESFNINYFMFYDDVEGVSKDYTLMVIQALLSTYYDKYEIASEIDTVCSLIIDYHGK